MEEFGFVPNRENREKRRRFEAALADLEGGSIVFHDNEYTKLKADQVANPRDVLGPLDINLDLTDTGLNMLQEEPESILSPQKDVDLVQLLDLEEEGSNDYYLNISKAPSPIKPRSRSRRRRPSLIDHNDAPHLGQADLESRPKRFQGDLYTPCWVRGRGVNREGYCELCSPGQWFRIKQSAYWYHLNFYHGVSAATGRPWDPPVAYRERGLVGNREVELQGKCATCDCWITLGSYSKGALKSESDLVGPVWWRHVQKCSSTRSKQ